MSQSLFSDNKKYISAKEASSLTGYSRDYIGQLARSNKIDSKRIGRVWYIGEESILKHNNSKKYISAKEASSLTGYSRDYIGQLARSNKIDSKRIGRVWYIGEESILKYNNLPIELESTPKSGPDADTIDKKILYQKPTLVEKIQWPEISEAPYKKFLSITERLLLFTFGFLLIVGVFSASYIYFSGTLKNISPVPANFLAADLTKLPIGQSFPIKFSISDLTTAYKNYLSPTLAINISDLTTAYKNYLTPAIAKIVPTGTALSPRTSGFVSVSALTSALEKLLNEKEFADKLRGPQGPPGPKGDTGTNAMYPNQLAANIYPSAPAAIPAVFMPVGITQPNPSANFSGASYFAATNLSSGQFTTNTANITTLSVSGSSIP